MSRLGEMFMEKTGAMVFAVHEQLPARIGAQRETDTASDHRAALTGGRSVTAKQIVQCVQPEKQVLFYLPIDKFSVHGIIKVLLLTASM